jgi:hypothetical protein
MAEADSKGREVKAELDRVRRASTGYQDMQRLMDRYAIERFLYRLGRSRYADTFVLKGAMLLAVYLPAAFRSTRDADLLGFGSFTPQGIKMTLAAICSDEQDDGLVFDATDITVQSAGRDREYPGFTVVVPTRLGNGRCDIKIDIGFGEAVVPPAQKHDYPTILPMPNPRVRMYPFATVVAEKFEALVKLGMSNTRMKDFSDLSQIARHCEIDGDALGEALLATFERRRTPIPQATPLTLTAEFYDNRRKKADWNAFLRRHSLPREVNLADACADIERFLVPIARALASAQRFRSDWRGGRWI